MMYACQSMHIIRGLWYILGQKAYDAGELLLVAINTNDAHV